MGLINYFPQNETKSSSIKGSVNKISIVFWRQG